jgi:hypothetical protein
VIHEGADEPNNVMTAKEVVTLKELHKIAIDMQLTPSVILSTESGSLDPDVGIMGANNGQRLGKSPVVSRAEVIGVLVANHGTTCNLIRVIAGYASCNPVSHYHW